MRRRARLFALLGLLGLCAAGVLPARPVAAHGGVVWIDDNYGNLHIVVSTTPTTTDREVRFTILINQYNYGDPISDAQVSFQAVLSGTAASAVPPLDVQVPPEAGQDGFYDYTTLMPRYGDWRVTVHVKHGADESGAAFTLPVQPPPDLGSPVWLLALLPVVIGAGAAIFLYFWRVPGRTPGAAPPTSIDSDETIET
jgi:hypothetical protein